MSTISSKTLVRRILQHKAAIREHDEAMVHDLEKLSHLSALPKIAAVGGKSYRIANIFEAGDATWRPSRIHKYHLVEVKG